MANEDWGVADLASLLGRGRSSDGRRKERLKRAEIAPTGIASGRTGFRAKAAIRMRALNRLRRPERTFLFICSDLVGDRPATIGIGAKVVGRTRAVAFQIVEVAISNNLVAGLKARRSFLPPRARRPPIEPATRLRKSPKPTILAVIGGGVRRMLAWKFAPSTNRLRRGDGRPDAASADFRCGWYFRVCACGRRRR